MKLIILTFFFIYFTFTVLGQKDNYTLHSSSQVVIINEETLVGHFSDLDIKNFEFKQCNKQIFLTPPFQYKGETVRYQDTHYECYLEGEISESKRVGTWIYWNEEYYPNSYRNKRYEDKIINYTNDSIYVSQNNFGVAKELVYNLDSTVINGHYIFNEKFKVTVSCSVDLDSNCTYINNSRIITKSSITDLESTINKIQYKYLNGQFR